MDQTGNELINPEYPKEPQKQRAYTLFVARGIPASTICRDHDIPRTQLDAWIKEDNWHEGRSKVCLAQRESASRTIGAMVARRAAPLIENYANLQDQLVKQFQAHLEGDEILEPKELRLLTQSMASAFGMSQSMFQLAGLGEQSLASQPTNPNAPATAIQVNILNGLLDNAARQKQELLIVDPSALGTQVEQ